MKINYLGTGAAERIPGIFVIVNYVSTLERKGREIRTQTQLIIDDVLLIDFPGILIYTCCSTTCVLQNLTLY